MLALPDQQTCTRAPLKLEGSHPVRHSVSTSCTHSYRVALARHTNLHTQLSKIMKVMLKSMPVASARRPFAAGNKGSNLRIRCPWKSVTGRRVSSSHVLVRAAAGKCTCSQLHQSRSPVATYLLLLLSHSLVGGVW